MTNITYYGHSCFMVDVGGVNILFDPFITGNDLAKNIDIMTLKPDYILLSHGHQDHILDAEAIAKNTGAPILSNFEIVNWYGGKGIENGIPANHGGMVALGDTGVNVRMMQAVHTSSFPDGSYAGQPCAFVVYTADEKHSFYYSGDTALHYDMKLVGEEFMLDFAILCMGDHFTMGSHCAAKAAEFVGADKVVAMHFDTFPPITLDRDQAHKFFRETGKTLIIPEIGESFSI